MSGVSGDFFDFYMKDDKVDGAGLFDVSGHGISSGLLTLIAKSIIYRNFRNMENEKLGMLMNSINKALINEIGQTGYYITGILLRFKESVVEYANSAHPHMLFRKAHSGKVGKVIPHDGDGIVGNFLGVSAMEEEYKSLGVKLNQGDCVFLYTDGLADMKNPQEEPFEDERILQALKDAPGETAQGIVDYVVKVFYDFTQKKNGPTDDLTVICIRKK
jgi:sigma-B regulation protein RsbU (phosphoserine phosphatase)